MKIFMMGEYYPPLRNWYLHGGAAEGVPAVLAFYKYLGSHSEHKVDVQIFTMDINKTITLANGSTLKLVSIPGRNYRLWKLKVLLYWLKNGGKHIEGKSYDVIYGQGTWTSVARYWGRKLNLPSIGRIYGTIITSDWQNGRWWKLYTRHLPELLGLHNPCDLTVITRDGTQYSDILRHYHPQARQLCLYNGINEDYKRQLVNYALPSKTSDDTLQLAYIGRLFSYKQQRIALLMCSELLKLGRPYTLHIVGEGPDLPMLQSMAEDLGIDAHIIWVGSLEQYALMTYLEHIDICLFYYEGGSLGNTLWECGLAGRVISTINTGNTSSVIKDNDTGLIATDKEAFAQVMAQRIAKLTEDDMQALGQRIRSWTKKHIGSWTERFDIEMEQLSALLNRHHQQGELG